MFDAGFWELLLISIIALIVVGPDKIPGLAKSVGKFVGKIKHFVSETQESVQQEFGTDELKEQFGFNESDSILEIVKDTEKQIKGHFDSITETTDTQHSKSDIDTTDDTTDDSANITSKDTQTSTEKKKYE